MINEIQQLQFGREMGIHTKIVEKPQNTMGFKGFLQQAIQNAEVTNEQFVYDTDRLLTGEVDNIAEVTINAQKAQTALSLIVNVRDKAVDAYKEIMNMSL